MHKYRHTDVHVSDVRNTYIPAWFCQPLVKLVCLLTCLQGFVAQTKLMSPAATEQTMPDAYANVASKTSQTHPSSTSICVQIIS